MKRSCDPNFTGHNRCQERSRSREARLTGPYRNFLGCQTLLRCRSQSIAGRVSGDIVPATPCKVYLRQQKRLERMRYWHFLIAAMFVLLLGRSAAAAGSTPEVWFFLRGDYITKMHGVDSQQGWQRLAEANQPWPDFMDHVQVLAVNGGVLQVPDELLAKVFARLKQKSIAFGMEVLAQNWAGEADDRCGKGVEGYTNPSVAARSAQKIKAAGGELAYIVMDGPLYHGHYFNGPNACHSSIQNVAERAAAIVQEYQKVFPAVKIGDTEQVPALTQQLHWQDDYRQWRQAFLQATGKPISFLSLDINWPADNWHWHQSVTEVADFTRSVSLPLGIIYNATVPIQSRTSSKWMDSAEQNITQLEDTLGIVPAKALFESWGFFPRVAFTNSSEPGTDHIVRLYLRKHGVQ